jgi:hypothetical protein
LIEIADFDKKSQFFIRFADYLQKYRRLVEKNHRLLIEIADHSKQIVDFCPILTKKSNIRKPKKTCLVSIRSRPGFVSISTRSIFPSAAARPVAAFDVHEEEEELNQRKNFSFDKKNMVFVIFLSR